MRTLKVCQVDSFTTEKFKGNPAGVVLNADGLSDQEMQHIARELNNSETAFIFSPDGNDHEIKIRFFTPKTEVPVCGHATIAAHYVRAIEHKLNLHSFPEDWNWDLTGRNNQRSKRLFHSYDPRYN